jgi:hypothetical protein
MDIKELPTHPSLEQYKKQAKDLVKAYKSNDPEAIRRIKNNHPHIDKLPDSDIPNAKFALADAQLVIARENGFPSWAKFKEFLLFRDAVQALDSGDIQKLEALLDKHPWLVRYHCHKGKWYEEGYFAGATLLNHIAGNPIRGPIPSNILDITRLLLRRGARDEPPRPKYTIGLLLKSKQASEAGVALPLIDLLMEAEGIELDLTAPDILIGPLGNDAPATAEALIRRGAKINIRHTAALGRLDLVKRFVNEGARVKADESFIPLPEESGEAKAQMEMAFIEACMCGRTGVTEFLLDRGVDPSSQINSGQTGLHYPALDADAVQMDSFLSRDFRQILQHPFYTRALRQPEIQARVG